MAEFLTRMAPHPTDDNLELYAVNRLPETAAGPVEEQSVVCTECQELLVRDFRIDLSVWQRRNPARGDGLLDGLMIDSAMAGIGSLAHDRHGL